LAQTSNLVANYHVTAVEQLGASGEPVFSHRVLPGSTSRSFGIEVAKMAGLPLWVIERAHQIAAELLTQNSTVHGISALPAAALIPGEVRNGARRPAGKPKAAADETEFVSAPRQLALDW
jgi:DNA mismatch repair ATPase MutS